MGIELKELAINHDYYASGSNYYSSDASCYYDTWADFYNEFHDADIDMNLVFRWDIHQIDESKYSMQVIIIGQRKGIYMPIHIDNINEQDVPQIEQFMKPHFEKLLSIWQPFSGLFIKALFADTENT